MPRKSIGPNGTVQTSIRLPRELYDQIRELSPEGDLSRFVRGVLQTYFDHPEVWKQVEIAKLKARIKALESGELA